MAVAFLVVAAASVVVVAIVAFPDATFVVIVITAFANYVDFVLVVAAFPAGVAALFVTFRPDGVFDAIPLVVDDSSWEEGLTPPVLSSATPFKHRDHKRLWYIFHCIYHPCCWDNVWRHVFTG